MPLVTFFFIYSFLNELASEAGQEPVEYRSRLLDSPRDRGVFELALEQAGDVPSGMHRGVALFESFGS